MLGASNIAIADLLSIALPIDDEIWLLPIVVGAV
jgi:hypothetical protein